MPESRSLRVLVVDDEPLCVKRLVNLLRGREGVELVETAEDGEEAVRAIRDHRPNLVFLDIQMPRKTGVEVVQAVGPEQMPVTIFVTAYDEFALRAFDLAAVDYLVKPFDNDRFEEAFRRARRRVGLEELERVQSQIRTLLDNGTTIADPTPPPARHYLERVAVHMRGRTRVVQVADIDYVTASGSYAELHVGETRHLVRESLQALEEGLDPAEFVRIHRSAIVRLSQVDTLSRGEGGDYHLRLKSGANLKVSRYRREELEGRIGSLR